MENITLETLKMCLNNGFTLIEVLISTLILFIVIATLSVAFKQYSAYRLKQQKYEIIYMSVLSLKDKFANEDLSRTKQVSGTINGLKYSAVVSVVQSKRNFVYGVIPKESGNKGMFLVTLYKIVLHIAGRSYVFYQTQYRKYAF